MAGPEDPDIQLDDEFTLGDGVTAAQVYEEEQKNREQVCEMGRQMAELTIPSVFPPKDYKAGDDIPGNNHSVGAQCVNSLAAKILFQAFPPNLPMMRLEPIETKLKEQMAADPQYFARLGLSMALLEKAHRRRMEATSSRSALFGCTKLLLIGGNALWRHVNIDTPTYHRPDSYVVVRDSGGHPIMSILEETVKVATLEPDIQDLVLAHKPDLLKQDEWQRETCIYSVCKLDRKGNDWGWRYWQEYDGGYIPGTGVLTAYDDAPMWPAWLIPVYGGNWGRGYCEEYRGDLYTLEAHASAINDIASLAAWAIIFAKPGGSVSLRQAKKARNLEMLPGKAEDLTVFRSEKTADGKFVMENFQMVARRLSAAFLVMSSIQRDGERVTAEEIARLGSELDRAMGGLYTEFAQTHQQRIVNRFVRLHEEEEPDLPVIPDEVVRISVVTGIDAMGRNQEGAALRGLVGALTQAFPQKAQSGISFTDFANRLAATEGIDPKGLILTEEDIQAATAKAQQQNAMMTLLDKGAGPAVKGMADMATQQMQPAAPEGAPASG